MQLNLVVNLDVLTQRVLLLKNGPKRLGINTAVAANDTGEYALRKIEEHVRRRFVIREPTLFFGRPGGKGGVAGILDRAFFPARPFAVIRTGAEALSGGKRGPVLFPQFETGGERRPTLGGTASAVPLLGRARPAINRRVPPELTFAGMHLVAYRGRKKLRRKARARHVRDTGVFGEFGRLLSPEVATAGLDGLAQFKGRNRTFLLKKTPKEPFGAVFQRFGPERGDIREIWAFRRVRLDARLDYVATVRAAANEVFRTNLARRLNESLEYARVNSFARALRAA